MSWYSKLIVCNLGHVKENLMKNFSTFIFFFFEACMADSNKSTYLLQCDIIMKYQLPQTSSSQRHN